MTKRDQRGKVPNALARISPATEVGIARIVAGIDHDRLLVECDNIEDLRAHMGENYWVEPEVLYHTLSPYVRLDDETATAPDGP